MAACHERGVLIPIHADWPRSLVGLPRAPASLHYEGDRALLGLPMVAIVGARRCTRTGREWAASLSAAVVAAGGAVVSGLAVGVDAEAHVGARGRTIAVLGQGIDAPMARWQRDLRERILRQGGLVLSEFAPDMPASAWSFPMRNRIIAGLSRGVVVVEAAARSGSKNTARHALEYGRELLVVPGPPDVETCVGCLDLLEEGAGVVRGPESVVALLPARAPDALPPC